MERVDEKSSLYKGLSLVGVCGLTMLLWVTMSDVESIARVALLMLCGVFVNLGLVGACGWLALVVGRRMRFAGEDTCAFAGGIAGGALLFTIGHLI